MNNLNNRTNVSGIFVKRSCSDMFANPYFYQIRKPAADWYDNYRDKALLTSYDHTKTKGIDH